MGRFIFYELGTAKTRCTYLFANRRADRMKVLGKRPDIPSCAAKPVASRKTHLTTLEGKGREAVHPYGHSQHPDAPVKRELFKKEVPHYWKDRAAETAK